MKKILKTFQQIGSSFLQEHPHALLADNPGLGKTLQVIDAAEKLGFQRIIVVCPASVRMNWYAEIEACGANETSWHVISYEQACKLELRDDYAPDLLVLDEVHFLKTPTSKRTQAIFGNEKGLARRARYKWCLTGTPVLNRPRELYPVLKTLASECIAPYDTFNRFAQRYCGAYYDGRSINTRGASRLDELAARLTPFMLRRTKADVMPELPAKIITRIPLKLTPAEMLGVVVAETEIGDREAFVSSAMENFSQLGDASHLLHVAGLAKVDEVVKFVKDLLETEDKVVVFMRHREVGARICAAFAGNAVLYQGGMSDMGKQHAIDLFVNDPGIRVFIGNIQAAGTGINGLQQVASSVVFAELDWVPGVMSQAVDRLHRIGQTASAVNVYLLHAPGTLESAVLGVNNAKGRVLDKLGLGLGW